MWLWDGVEVEGNLTWKSKCKENVSLSSVTILVLVNIKTFIVSLTYVLLLIYSVGFEGMWNFTIRDAKIPASWFTQWLLKWWSPFSFSMSHTLSAKYMDGVLIGHIIPWSSYFARILEWSTLQAIHVFWSGETIRWSEPFCKFYDR